jgi:undecaprenyl-diphosphatase
MTIVQSVLLGAIQGFAEFLPISSSGHLAIASYFLGESAVPLLFDVMLHLATLAAVILVYRARIAELLGVCWRVITRRSPESDRADRGLILAIIIATAITGVIGFAIKDRVEKLSPFWISCFLVVTGVLLLVSSRWQPKKKVSSPGLAQGVIVGIAQGIGVAPGISRSGITISASLMSGVERKAAGEFSFLLSIPAILAAFILELKNADTLTGSVQVLPLALGMLTAFVVGFFALKFLIGLINKGKLGWFALYLIPVGTALAAYFALT